MIQEKKHGSFENQKDQETGQYRPITSAVIGMMEKIDPKDVENLLNIIKIKESEEQRVYVSEADSIEQLHIEGPSRVARADVVFLAALQDGLKKGDLASQYLHISPSHFSMIRNPKKAHKPNLDLIVTAALVNHHPFCVEVVNHVLMEIELPGLFTDTYDYNVNLRNFILARILEYAQDHPCPRARWIDFAWEALDYLGMQPLQDVPVGNCELSVKEEELLTKWLEEAKRKCVKTDYMVLRREYLDRFAEENHKSKTEAISLLAEIAAIHISTVRDVFASEYAGKGTRGSRDTLIQGAVYMGCTLDEINTLLRQANHSLLYPFREDSVDAINMTKALFNKLAREQSMAEKVQN